MGGRWPYSWCFVGCYLQDLFKIARSTRKDRTKSNMFSCVILAELGICVIKEKQNVFFLLTRIGRFLRRFSCTHCSFLEIKSALRVWLRFQKSKWIIIPQCWRQHPTRHQLYGHLPPIPKTIQVRRTRHAGYCWRSRDGLISDVLLWTLTYARAKAGRPARTDIQQLCEDKGCSPEDLPEAMNDREK